MFLGRKKQSKSSFISSPAFPDPDHLYLSGYRVTWLWKGAGSCRQSFWSFFRGGEFRATDSQDRMTARIFFWFSAAADSSSANCREYKYRRRVDFNHLISNLKSWNLQKLLSLSNDIVSFHLHHCPTFVVQLKSNQRLKCTAVRLCWWLWFSSTPLRFWPMVCIHVPKILAN